MDRLADLSRLLEIAKKAGDSAEIAKLEAKIALCAPKAVEVKKAK